MTSSESIFMLRHQVYDEAAVSELLGGSAARFFILAHRIAWGVAQSDLVRVDLEAARAAVVREYGRCPVAHLLDALACLASGRQDLADAARERAATLAEGHPLGWICPTDGEWAGEIPDQKLEEVIPGRLWRTRAWYQTQGTRLRSSGNGTLVRTDSGDLAFLNAVALSDAVAARIRELGEVRWLTTGSKVHSIYVPELVARYPQARNLGVAGHARHPASRHLKFDGVLGVDDGLPDEFEVLILEGSEMGDAQIFHQPTRTLISTHLAGTNLKSEALHESDFFGRLYGLAFGLIDDVGWLAYQTILWTDLPALQRSLRHVLAWDFKRIASDHNDRVFEHEITHRIREVLDWTARLDPGQHRRMVARFFWHQPRFLYDMVRYKLRTRVGRAVIAVTGAQGDGTGLHPWRYFVWVQLLSIPFYWSGRWAIHGFPFYGWPAAVAMIVVPAAVATVLTAREQGGRAAFRLWIRIADVWRIRGVGWALTAFLLPPAVTLMAFAVVRYFHLPLPDAVVFTPAAAPGLFVTFFLGAIPEEIGWTGYATEPLQKRYGIVSAGLIIGAVWALWHVPLWWSGDGWEGQNHTLAVLGQAASVVFLRVIMGWFYVYGGRSLFLAIVVHAMDNTCWKLFPNQGSHFNPSVTAVILAFIAFLVGASVRGQRLIAKP